MMRSPLAIVYRRDDYFLVQLDVHRISTKVARRMAMVLPLHASPHAWVLQVLRTGNPLARVDMYVLYTEDTANDLTCSETIPWFWGSNVKQVDGSPLSWWSRSLGR